MSITQFIDFDGSGQALHFLHANGYPPECYRPLLTGLSAHYHVFAMHQRPLWSDSQPGSINDWHPLTDDLLRFLDEQNPGPLIGVGHSVGGIVTLRAALRQPPLDSAGVTTLSQLAALQARCALVLGSDSGPLHLAVAIEAPTVHLYGPVSVSKFGPWGDPARHVVLATGWDCAPCNRLDWPATVLAQHQCMAAISPEQVLAAAKALLMR